MNDVKRPSGAPRPAAAGGAASGADTPPAAPAGPLFPIVLKDAAFQALDCPSYYLLTADGLFLQRATPLFTASVPVDGGVPGLQPHRSGLTLHLPRLPEKLLAQAMGFFRAVYDRWRGEAILLMFYAPESGHFALRAPPQVITGRVEYGRFRADLRLDYRACERPGPEYLKIGSFHSHGPMSPAHSSVDVHDEFYETGLHLTAGYINTSLPEFAAAFVVGRTRFTVRPGDVLPPFRTAERPPAAWMQQVQAVAERWGAGYAPAGGGFGPAINGWRDAPAATAADDDDGREDDDGGTGSPR